MQKIVFNAHYLMYLDTAMGAYWRELALPYADTMASLEGDLFVKKATLEYHAPALYDELLQVGLRLESIGNSSLRYAGAVFHNGALLVSAELIYVFADPASRCAWNVVPSTPPTSRCTIHSSPNSGGSITSNTVAPASAKREADRSIAPCIAACVRSG
jgi:YbgC/YbaW family acyl-CoA thioester hydrolase